jgi:hypothetical protein
MSTHYLSEQHQNMLLAIILAYIAWRRRIFNNFNGLRSLSYSTGNMGQETIRIQSPEIENSSEDCTQSNSEYDAMNAESAVLDLNNVKILHNDGTITFVFTRNYDEMTSPFSIYSPIFKTSPYGYSFVLRLCSIIEPENENQGYLSIYITLLRGEYDSILIYPFSYNISFSLCDQSGQKKDIISILNVDSNSSSFARPISEKNNEIGIIKFCPLSYLTNAQNTYLKDGIFFIKVLVDFLGNGLNPFVAR